VKRLLILLPMLFAVLHGIVCIAGDGSVIPQDRQYHFSYHNSTNDYNLYGANKWAVRFNFRSAYPGMAQVAFNVRGARLWFPNVGDNVTVELYSDLASQPGSVISATTVPVLTNQIDVLFDSISTHETVWLVVTYATNMHNRFVAASAGGGANSYYMNQIGDQSYLSSLGVSGFNCELLFGVLGDFVLSEADLQLTSFDLQGNLNPGGRAYPAFTVYNHSDIPVDSAHLRVQMSKPGYPIYDTHEIIIEQVIEARSSYEYSPEGFFILLPEQPSQVRLDVLLLSEFTENDTLLTNNSVSKTYNIFNAPMPVKVVENFLRDSENAAIANLQEPFLQQDIHVLHYYPMLSDSLSNLGSIQRFNWYGFNSIPRTVGNGHKRITGLTPGYEASFADLIQNIANDKSFISQSSCRLDSIPQSENVNLSIFLTNQNTSMYSGVGQSLMSSSRFFVGLFSKPASDESSRYVLHRWIAFADTISNAIDMGTTVSKNYSISASGLFDDSLDLSYRIYYWIQGTTAGRIRYVGYETFDPVYYTGNSDLLAPALNFGLFPNPLRMNEKLSISLEKQTQASIKIYNLRGQLIYSQSGIMKELSLDSEIFPGSGIYFVRITDATRRGHTKKISIIK